MDDRKIILFLLSLIIYGLYSIHMWFVTVNVHDENTHIASTNRLNINFERIEKKNTPPPIIAKKAKVIPLHLKDACSISEVFTKKPLIKKENIKAKELENENNIITVIGITVFLVILLINAMLDILKVKEEERLRLKLNPDGERRKSLAEFANKKSLRRESSKFGLQLFQIAESIMGKSDDTKERRESRMYTRGDSINSYLSDKNPTSESAPPSVGETPTDIRVTKRQSVAKLFGARPTPMVRRSSFPALPLNPDIQALMLSGKQPSFDSDDEDGKGRRVRIIRRY